MSTDKFAGEHDRSRTFSPKPYRPRRKRSDDPPGFQLTERDIEIVRLVAEHRFLDSDHIRRLVSGSDKNISNRLKALFEHRYLDRPDCQYDTYRLGGGSKAIAYALADRGARLLSDQVDGKRSYWTHKNRKVGRPFLEHSLATADFAVALRAAALSRQGVDVIDGEDLIAAFPEETRRLDKPLRVSVPVMLQGARFDIGLEPDYAFSLYLTKASRRAFFLVEIDRGTMPVERHDLRQSSILRKLVAYQTLWKAKRHTQQFGWQNFRVLFVTTSAERVSTMIAACERQSLTRASPLFLFADRETLYQGDDVLAREFRDSYDNPQPLIPTNWLG